MNHRALFIRLGWTTTLGLFALCWLSTQPGWVNAQVPTSQAAIQPAPADLEFSPIGVAFLPIRDYTRSSTHLFSEQPTKDASGKSANPRVDELVKKMVAMAETEPRITVRHNLIARLDKSRRYSSTKQVVEERYSLGRDLYQELRLEPAEESLNLASKMAQDNFVDILDPVIYADIQLTLALVLLEQGETNLAHVALKRMFLVDPERRFAKGYYPASVEAAITGAWTDLQETGSVEMAFELDAVERLLRDVRAREVVTGALVKRDGVIVLRLVIYDGVGRAFRVREDIRVDSNERESSQLDAAISRWLACLPAATIKLNTKSDFPGPANPARRITVDSGLAHGLYLTRPTRDYFNSLGLVINVGWHAMPGLDVYAKINLYSSIADPLRDLQGTLTSARLILGSGLRFGDNRWQGELHPGIDLHYMGRFTVLTDPWCKFLGTNNERCNKTSVTDTEATLQIGVNLALGVRAYLSPNLYVAAQANFSLYPIKLQETNLNYLIGSELGVGYAF